MFLKFETSNRNKNFLERKLNIEKNNKENKKNPITN